MRNLSARLMKSQISAAGGIFKNLRSAAARVGLPRIKPISWSRTPIAGKIAALNVLAIFVFAFALWVTTPLRSSLIEERFAALTVNAQILAEALSTLSTIENTDALGATRPVLTPRDVDLWLDGLQLPDGFQVRVFSADLGLIGDTVGDVRVRPLKDRPGGILQFVVRILAYLERPFGARPILPARDVAAPEYPEVVAALSPVMPRTARQSLRRSPQGDLIMSVAEPIVNLRAFQGAILLSAEGQDIEALVAAEIRDTAIVLAILMLVFGGLSLYFGRTIAGPLHELADAADTVRAEGAGAAERIHALPVFTARHDEVGRLSRSLQAMNEALFARLGAIEQFAADVAHELKNPLTSLRSAVETLELAKTPENKARLVAIIMDDVRRLDRLITDISDASRLDAELARGSATRVNLARLLRDVVQIYRETRQEGDPHLDVKIDSGALPEGALEVLGIESRLAQVIRNLLSNAVSFSPREGQISLRGSLREKPERQAIIVMEDEGPGVPEENLETIFQRFYTERPEGEEFGKNSGLGLSISKQIVESHGGTIHAENRRTADGAICGARFVVALPLAPEHA